ncbi:MAG: hypothetical protein ACM3H7_07375 [Acidobacteriaceae bacterium]
MQAPITHILPLTIIRRERMLAAGGRIVARRGQIVHPLDVVAEARIRPEHLLLDVGRGLGLDPKEADHYIQHRAGDEVGAGDVIAGPVGIGRRVVRAPKSGSVVVTGEGQVLLELEGEFSELKAGYSGVVVETIEERGVVIEAAGSLIQGVWGNGKINFGGLKLQLNSPDERLTLDKIEDNLRDMVIVAGYCEHEKVLRSAERLPVKGMILASMDSALVTVALSMGYPILLVEGFGHLPMNQDAYKIFNSSAMQEASVNAEPWNRILNRRPEVVIATPEASNPEAPTELASFAIGQTVRVISSPYKSRIGTLTSLGQSFTLLPGGLRAQVAEVRVSNEESIKIPLSNLEIIG